MRLVVYFLISENNKRTYVGSSDNIVRRIKEHKEGRVKSTKSFGNFKYRILEHTNNLTGARERERYWKTTTGRRKLKKVFNKIKNNRNSPIARLDEQREAGLVVRTAGFSAKG